MEFTEPVVTLLHPLDKGLLEENHLRQFTDDNKAKVDKSSYKNMNA